MTEWHLAIWKRLDALDPQARILCFGPEAIKNMKDTMLVLLWDIKERDDKIAALEKRFKSQSLTKS